MTLYLSPTRRCSWLASQWQAVAPGMRARGWLRRGVDGACRGNPFVWWKGPKGQERGRVAGAPPSWAKGTVPSLVWALIETLRAESQGSILVEAGYSDLRDPALGEAITERC